VEILRKIVDLGPGACGEGASCLGSAPQAFTYSVKLVQAGPAITIFGDRRGNGNFAEDGFWSLAG
jgi:hypothetical protein